MPDSVSARIRNADELANLLERMPVDLADRVLEKAVKAGGNVFKDEIKRRAPVRTGAMRKSVRNNRGKAKVLEAARVVGPRSPAAHLVERGHARVWVHPVTGKRYAQGHVRAHPFILPGAIAAADDALDAIADELSKAVQRLAKSHGAK